MKTRVSLSFETSWNSKNNASAISEPAKLLMKQRKDPFSGKRFGNLTVRGYHHKDNYGHHFYSCRCNCRSDNCKKMIIARKDSLLRGEFPKCS